MSLKLRGLVHCRCVCVCVCVCARARACACVCIIDVLHLGPVFAGEKPGQLQLCGEKARGTADSHNCIIALLLRFFHYCFGVGFLIPVVWGSSTLTAYLTDNVDCSFSLLLLLRRVILKKPPLLSFLLSSYFLRPLKSRDIDKPL